MKLGVHIADIGLIPFHTHPVQSNAKGRKTSRKVSEVTFIAVLAENTVLGGGASFIDSK